jgi:hypothetical protein
VHTVTIVDAPRAFSVSRPDPKWVWLTGTPTAPAWTESTEAKRPQDAFDVRWCEPLTKAQFDAAKLTGADGKPLASSVSELGPAVWLDGVNVGWETLSRAGLLVVGEFSQDQRSAVAAALRTPLATPGDHWRAALLLRAINPSTPAAADFQPEALNILARQQGDMWAGAIGRLARVDAGLALQVSRRLVQIAYFPTSDNSGSWGVLWCEADPHMLDSLLTTPAASLATAATSFLVGQPQALAWVHDDAGLRDPFGGTPLSTIGVVPTGEVRTIATLSFGTLQPGEPVPVRPLLGQLLTSAASQRQSGGATSASIKVGTAALALPVGFSPVPASPPGMLISPFYRDWTLATFRRQQQSAVGGLAGSLMPASGAGGGWTLYFECRVEPGAEVEPERLRVWAGPTGAPVVAVEVAPDGSTRPAAPASSTATTAVSRVPGGWCATVTLPPAAIDASGVLRIGVEHVASSGLRSCWPRPMLPWQTEPGRWAIDTTAWDRELKP